MFLSILFYRLEMSKECSAPEGLERRGGQQHSAHGKNMRRLLK